MSRHWDPRTMDPRGKVEERVVEYAPKSYTGDRTHCLLCRAWLERYRDGYGNHWLDSTQGGKCADGREHQRSPDTPGEA